MYELDTLHQVIAEAISFARERGDDQERFATDAAKAFKAGLAAYNQKQDCNGGDRRNTFTSVSSEHAPISTNGPLDTPLHDQAT